MFRQSLTQITRPFARAQSTREAVKDAAKAFKADGKIGEKFTSKGEIGEKFEKNVGGPFSKDGAIGKQFEKDGALGGTAQKAAEETEDAAKKQ